jgi:hypothetical protein
MTWQRTTPAWRRAFLVTAALATATFVAVGARDITVELSQRPHRVALVHRHLVNLAGALVSEVPSGETGDWQRVVEHDPIAVLRYCARQ